MFLFSLVISNQKNFSKENSKTFEYHSTLYFPEYIGKKRAGKGVFVIKWTVDW